VAKIKSFKLAFKRSDGGRKSDFERNAVPDAGRAVAESTLANGEMSARKRQKTLIAGAKRSCRTVRSK
jgi:hypothetical protein